MRKSCRLGVCNESGTQVSDVCISEESFVSSRDTTEPQSPSIQSLKYACTIRWRAYSGGMGMAKAFLTYLQSVYANAVIY